MVLWRLNEFRFEMHRRRSLAHIQYHIKGCEIEYKSYWPFKIDYENKKKAPLLSALRLGSGALIFSSAKAWLAPGSQPMPLALGLEIKSQIHKKYTAEPGMVGVTMQWQEEKEGTTVALDCNKYKDSDFTWICQWSNNLNPLTLELQNKSCWVK